MLAESRPTALLALRALTAVLADCRPTALLAPRAYTTVLAEGRPTALLARRAYTTVLADSGPAALLAERALTAVLAESRPTALLALRALTVVLADSNPAALLAERAPLPVGTSAAHLAVRPVLHPVLAWLLRGRGSLPLRPLLRRVLRHPHLDVHIREHPTHVRPPNRWHPPPTPVQVPRRKICVSVERDTSIGGAEFGSPSARVGRPLEEDGGTG